MALPKYGGPAFGAHIFIWADEWTPEGAGRVISSGAAVNEALIGATALWRDVIGDPDALVRDGLAFLRARVEEHGAP